MKFTTTLSVILAMSGSCLFAVDIASQISPGEPRRRDLTLIANPASFPRSPAELAKIKARVLAAEQAAVAAHIAAIEARIRKTREESEARIKVLTDERDALIRREKEIVDSLERSRR